MDKSHKKINEYLNLNSNSFREENIKNKDVIQLYEIFIYLIDNLQFTEFYSYKRENTQRLCAHIYTLFKEVVDNLILKNYNSMFSITRIILENYMFLLFLNNQNEDNNEFFYDFSETRTFFVLNNDKINKFNNKYNVILDTDNPTVWIKYINKKNKFKSKNNNGNGILSIAEQIDKVWGDLYCFHCNFSHASYTSLQFKLFYNDNKNLEKIYNNLVALLANLLRNTVDFMYVEKMYNEDESKNIKKLISDLKQIETNNIKKEE